MQSVYIQDKPNYFKKFFVLLSYLFVLVLLGAVLYIYYPVILVYISKPFHGSTPQGSMIIIPKINARAGADQTADPSNDVVMKQLLAHGLVHAQGTAVPGDSGTTFLIAQSSGYPWEITRENTAFLRLNELEIKDTILLLKRGYATTYVVWAKKEVWPDQVHDIINTVQDNSQNNQLIIQADTPIGTSFKRILIFAAPK